MKVLCDGIDQHTQKLHLIAELSPSGAANAQQNKGLGPIDGQGLLDLSN